MWIIEKVAPALVVVLIVLHQHVPVGSVRAVEVDQPPGFSDINQNNHDHWVDHNNNEAANNMKSSHDDDEFYIDFEPKHQAHKLDEGHAHELQSTGDRSKESRLQSPSQGPMFNSFDYYTHDEDPEDDAVVDDLYNDLMRSSSLMMPSHRVDNPHHVDELHHADHPSQNYLSQVVPEPHYKDHEETYIDTSDPNNPKHVHVEQKSASVVRPNGASHERYEAKTATSLNGNSFHHHSSSSSSSSSYSSSLTSTGTGSSSSSSGNGNHHQQQLHQHIPDRPADIHQSFRHPLTALPAMRPKRPAPLFERGGHVVTGPVGRSSFGRDSLVDPFEDVLPSSTFSQLSNRMKHLSRKNVIKLKRRIEAAQRRLDRTPY